MNHTDKVREIYEKTEKALQAMNQPIKWKEPIDSKTGLVIPVPRTVVQAIVVDKKYQALLIHRSPTVRSAANVWSVPSGMQEIGESINETIVRELEEEFSLKPIKIYPVGIYENISGDPNATEQYHWVIAVVVIVVKDINELINNEPDKHDITEIVSINWFDNTQLIKERNFHPTLSNFLINERFPDSLESLINNAGI